MPPSFLFLLLKATYSAAVIQKRQAQKKTFMATTKATIKVLLFQTGADGTHRIDAQQFQPCGCQLLPFISYNRMASL